MAQCLYCGPIKSVRRNGWCAVARISDSSSSVEPQTKGSEFGTNRPFWFPSVNFAQRSRELLCLPWRRWLWILSRCTGACCTLPSGPLQSTGIWPTSLLASTGDIFPGRSRRTIYLVTFHCQPQHSHTILIVSINNYIGIDTSVNSHTLCLQCMYSQTIILSPQRSLISLSAFPPSLPLP